MRIESKPEIAEVAEPLGAPRASMPVENEVTDKIIAAAIEVHRHLGPGLLESAYEECLCFELRRMGVPFQRQVHLPISYKGLHLDCAYKLDLLVQDAIIVEIKAIEESLPIHQAQLLTDLKASGKRIGLLINFNVPMLKSGLKRVVNHYTGPPLGASVSAPSASDPDQRETPASPKSPRDLRVLRVSAVSSNAANSEAL